MQIDGCGGDSSKQVPRPKLRMNLAAFSAPSPFKGRRRSKGLQGKRVGVLRKPPTCGTSDGGLACLL